MQSAHIRIAALAIAAAQHFSYFKYTGLFSSRPCNLLNFFPPRLIQYCGAFGRRIFLCIEKLTKPFLNIKQKCSADAICVLK